MVCLLLCLYFDGQGVPFHVGTRFYQLLPLTGAELLLLLRDFSEGYLGHTSGGLGVSAAGSSEGMSEISTLRLRALEGPRDSAPHSVWTHATLSQPAPCCA